MSLDATRWAWEAPIKNSSQRLVLLSLADRAGEHYTAWPSIKRLSKDTALNEKTVQKVLLDLIKLGLVIDTGERTGPTKRVKVLKLNNVKGREEYTQNRGTSKMDKGTQSKSKSPKTVTTKQQPMLGNSGKANDLPNSVQSQALSLPLKLIEEHDWIPQVDQLVTKLKIAGYESNVDLIIGLPRFEFELSAFNSHFDHHLLSDSKKLHKFAAWIIDKFERYKKQNPDYGVNSLRDAEEPLFAIPAIELLVKPKGLLGNL